MALCSKVSPYTSARPIPIWTTSNTLYFHCPCKSSQMSSVCTSAAECLTHSSDCCRVWSWTWSCVWRAATGGLASLSWGVLTRALGLVLMTSSQVSAKCSTSLLYVSTSLLARRYYKNLCTVESDRNLMAPRKQLLSVSLLRAVRVRYWRVVLIGLLLACLLACVFAWLVTSRQNAAALCYRLWTKQWHCSSYSTILELYKISNLELSVAKDVK